MERGRKPQPTPREENRESRASRYRVNWPRFLVSLALLLGAGTLLLRGVNALADRLSGDEAAQAPASAAASTGKASHTANPDGALAGAVVVVDAGHGGFDCGAIGASGSREDTINLQVALCLRTALEDAGATVIMTRVDANALAQTKEDDMARRRQIIEDSGSDVVVSIHMNALENDNVTSGYQVYHLPGSTGGEALARAVDEGLIAQPEGFKSQGLRTDNLYILKSGTQPCVLVECGFLSNPEEESNLQNPDYQHALASGICQGVAAYLADREQ